MYVRESGELDGSPRNLSIPAMMGEKNVYPFKGPALAVSYPGTAMDPEATRISPVVISAFWVHSSAPTELDLNSKSQNRQPAQKPRVNSFLACFQALMSSLGSKLSVSETENDKAELSSARSGS